MYEIVNYVDPGGKDAYGEWYIRLRDVKAKKAIDRRLFRLQIENFGDHKYCREGVCELRIDVGAGYRIYYAIKDSKVVLLLCGGDKSSQSSDISRAIANWIRAQEEAR